MAVIFPRNFRTSEFIREEVRASSLPWSGGKLRGRKAERDPAISGCLKRTLTCLVRKSSLCRSKS